MGRRKVFVKDRHKLSLVHPVEASPAVPPPDKLWNIKQAADWLSMTEMSLRAMLKRRQIPASTILKFGRRVRFRSDLLREWALRQQSA
jgi:excisionase family DNA binding protein